jgi:beta-phosphoglucomutase
MHAAKRAMLRQVESENDADIAVPPGFIIFCDMDGTLVDTDYANYLSYRHAIIEVTCGNHDVEFSRERLDRKSLNKRLPSLTAAQCEVIASLKAAYFAEFILETRLNTALANLLTKYREVAPEISSGR